MTPPEAAQYGVAAAGLVVAIAWAQRVRAGRDPLGPPASGAFEDLAIPLFFGILAWFAADYVVVTRVRALQPGSEAVQYAASVGHAVVGVALLPFVARRWPASAVPLVRRVVAGFAGGLALFGVVGVVGLGIEGIYRLTGHSLPTQGVVDTARAADGAVALLPAAAAILLAPFAEEVLYRGALLGTLARTAPPATALVLQAAIFGLVHVIGHPPSLPLAIPLALVGWVCGWVALRTRSLVPAILVHATFNGIQFAFIRAS